MSADSTLGGPMSSLRHELTTFKFGLQETGAGVFLDNEWSVLGLIYRNPCQQELFNNKNNLNLKLYSFYK